MTIPRFVAAILVGGRSRRFGSDKALADLGQGEPNYLALARALAHLKPDFIAICGRSEQLRSPGYQAALELELAVRLQFVEDSYPAAGPATGLLSLWRLYPHHPALLVACDYRHLPSQLPQQLLAAARAEANYDAYVFENDQGIYESTLALYQPSCLPKLQELSLQSNYSLQMLLRSVATLRLKPVVPLPQDVDHPNVSRRSRQT